MIKYFSEGLIRKYNSKDKQLIEDFRDKCFKEGNNSLSLKKYNPDNIKGQTLMFFIQGELASISVCEASHYTGDPDISSRLCRYHILKKYRHCNAGFKMLPMQVAFAKQQGFKIIYWTQNTKHRSLNALYQHRKKMPGKSSFFKDDLYKSFKKEPFLFKVSLKSDLLQYIYSKSFESGYLWRPKKNILYPRDNS